MQWENHNKIILRITIVFYIYINILSYEKGYYITEEYAYPSTATISNIRHTHKTI